MSAKGLPGNRVEENLAGITPKISIYKLLLYEYTSLSVLQKISYNCLGTVWKIEIFSKDSILVEIRDTDLFKTEWKLFSINEEHCHKTLNVEKNSWWYSLAQTSNSLIFLHELKQGKNPEINGLKIINGIDGAFTDLPNYQLTNINKEKNTYSISDTSGTVTEESFKQKSNQYKVNLPILYPIENTYFSTFSEIVCNHIELIPCLECEYLEINNHIAIGFYEKIEENKYSYYLLVLNSEGDKIYLEQIHQDLKGKMNGIFFSLSNKIIYTTNKNEIEIITL